MIELLLIVWTLAVAPGPDGLPAAIPPWIALEVAAASEHHGVAVELAGAVLAAENRSRRYDPATVGRYGRGGELGLYQLAPDPWSREVAERCDSEERARHHRYRGAAPCLWLDGRPDLTDAAENVESAMIVLAYLEEKGREGGVPRGVDWIAAYRCAPRAYRWRLSSRCAGSIWRVRAWERSISLTLESSRAWLEAFEFLPARMDTAEVAP